MKTPLAKHPALSASIPTGCLSIGVRNSRKIFDAITSSRPDLGLLTLCLYSSNCNTLTVNCKAPNWSCVRAMPCENFHSLTALMFGEGSSDGVYFWVRVYKSAKYTYFSWLTTYCLHTFLCCPHTKQFDSTFCAVSSISYQQTIQPSTLPNRTFNQRRRKKHSDAILQNLRTAPIHRSKHLHPLRPWRRRKPLQSTTHNRSRTSPRSRIALHTRPTSFGNNQVLRRSWRSRQYPSGEAEGSIWLRWGVEEADHQ